MTAVPHVVVIGAGFAGIATVRRLARSTADEETPLRVTLVDRHNYHTFQPLLYQAATAGLEPQSIGRNVRSLLRRTGVDFRYGEVTAIDRSTRRVQFREGEPLDYDVLVVAAGAETADYGIDGVAEHAFYLKWIPDATQLRDHLLTQFERVEADPAAIGAGALTFVVAGGGPTGVELAGAISELIDQVIRLDHPRVERSSARIILVEMLDDVLPPYSAASRRYARQALSERNVEVRTDTAIEKVGPDEVELSDGDRIATRTVVWTAGVRAGDLAGKLDAEQVKGGRVKVRRDLRLPDDDAVFVVGDLAAATDRGGDPLPQLAAVAMQQGRHVADQVPRVLAGRRTESFRYRDKGTMATIGRRDAIAELPLGLKLHGTVGWLAWLGLHLLQLVGFRNRVTVLWNWTYSYVTYDRAARMILQRAPRVAERPDSG